MNSSAIKNFIGAWVALILAIALLSAAKAWAYPNPIVRDRIDRIEAFTNHSKGPEDPIEPIMNLSPSDTTLEKPREPYSLLNDTLKPFHGVAPSPTSKTCYEADFQTRLERTGNFRQMTNNYTRGVPDSCSAPNHDLSLSFYEVEPLAP